MAEIYGRPKEKLTAHHLLFYEKEWSLRPEGKHLREDSGLIVPLNRTLHNEMHNRVPLVPLLGIHALQRVAHDYVMTTGLYQNIDNFALATERALKHPRSHELERKLGELTIEAIMMQKDIIKEFRQR